MAILSPLTSKKRKERLYGLTDYMRDREKESSDNQNVYTSTVQPLQSTPSRPNQTVTKYPSQTTKNQTPTTTVTQPAVTQAPAGINQAETNANISRPLTQVEIAQDKMAQARQKVYDVLNRKFEYNARSSPLYSILERQYEKQAQKAAGEAYARSVANTGGYGSSYATMAADEARRRTMEGFNDQQLALYQAARDEFYAERDSALDWYTAAKQMYGDAQSEELSAAYDAAYTLWNGENEDQVRAGLAEQGVSASQINTIMTQLKSEKLSGVQTDAAITEYQDAAAYNNAYKAASGLYNGSNDAEVQQKLLADGMSPAYINAALTQLRKEYAGNLESEQYIAQIKETSLYKQAMESARSLKNSGKSLDEIKTELARMYSATMVDEIVSELNTEQRNQAIADYEDKQMQAAIATLEGDKNAEEAFRAALDLWNGSNASEIRKSLAGKYGTDDINKAIIALKEYAVYERELDEKLTSNYSQTTNDAYSLGLEVWTGTNEAQVAEGLRNMGFDEQTVDQAIEMLKQNDKAAISDSVKQFSISPTLSGAKEIIDIAKRTGNEAQYAKDVSLGLSNEIIKALEDPSIGYRVLEENQDTWNELGEEEQKQTILDRLGEASKSGLVTEDDYKKALIEDMNTVADSISKDEVEKPASEICDMVIYWQNCRDNGYMSEETYNSLVSNAAKKIDIPSLMGEQSVTLGEKAGKALDKINMPEWVQKWVQGSIDYGNFLTSPALVNSILSNFDWYRKQVGLTQDQEKAMKELLKAYRGGI